METSINNKCKTFTSLEQSKKLAEILPLESADMFLAMNGILPVMSKYIDDGLVTADETAIPCWSLAALLDVIPIMIGSIFEKNALRLRIDKSETDFNIWYDNIDTGMVEEGFDIIETNPIDACYEMILKLKEKNLL